MAETMPPPSLPHPAVPPSYFDPKASRVTEIIAGSVVLLVLPTLAVFLRLLSRLTTKAHLWWDDYTVIVAMVLSWAPNIINLISTTHGFGKHIYTQPPDTVFYFFKLLWAFEIVYFLALGFVKYAIIFFLYRIFPIIHFRRVLLGCHVFVTCWLISNLVVGILECSPPQDFWLTVGGQLSRELGGKCIDVVTFFLASGALNCAIDFFLLAMPIPLLWKLKTGTLQKSLLTVIFTIGMIGCVVSVVRIVYIKESHYNDMTWDYAPISLWTAAEPSIGVVSACLPSLRPLFAKCFKRGIYKTKQSTKSSNLSSNGLAYSWQRSTLRNDSRRPSEGGTFNRLHEGSTSDADLYPPWTNKWAAYGGRDVKPDEYDLNSAEAGDRRSAMLPVKGIRVKTTVTVSESVDWQDDLF